MADLRVFYDILNGKVRPEANWVRDLRDIDDHPDTHVAWTPEYMLRTVAFFISSMG